MRLPRLTAPGTRNAQSDDVLTPLLFLPHSPVLQRGAVPCVVRLPRRCLGGAVCKTPTPSTTLLTITTTQDGSQELGGTFTLFIGTPNPLEDVRVLPYNAGVDRIRLELQELSTVDTVFVTRIPYRDPVLNDEVRWRLGCKGVPGVSDKGRDGRPPHPPPPHTQPTTPPHSLHSVHLNPTSCS